ncbi:hypothetical protein [Nocardia sp. NBC_00416]|uniref:hypothetical protein n=1 Tax=Nocardia sp. NBC_00416 TaxID=2975991 RepID=UPI002E20F776
MKRWPVVVPQAARVIEVGDTVRIGASGRSVFLVREVDPDEGRAVIEAVGDAPGSYPFSLPLTALVRVDPGD